jgi:hypothetical protein
MTLPPARDVELRELIAALREGALSPEQAARLNGLLADSPSAREVFARHTLFQATLELALETKKGTGPICAQHPPGGHQPKVGRGKLDRSPFSSAPPIIIVQTDPALPSPFSVRSFLDSSLFSYSVATVMMAVALLVAWGWKMTRYSDFVQGSPRQTAPVDRLGPESPMVGRITGLADCRWANARKAAVDGQPVRVGREYILAAGFMEITYQCGAKVVLEGPAVYEVESARGGFLSLGKLTARVESCESRVERETKHQAANPGESNGSRLSTLDSRLFSVRTPTAVVTDLGTEFGVEVETSGATRSHVFQGKIEVRSSSLNREPPASATASPVMVLGAGESVRVARDDHRGVVVVREPGQPGIFTRRMPRPTPIEVFNTGIGLKEGNPDPHWQIVAASNNPKFKPRAAVVTSIVPAWHLANNPAQSQWVSTSGLAPTSEAVYMPILPPNVTYTFRTTFQLGEVSPESAVLQGRFLADDRMNAIRLNGKPVPVPAHGDSVPFDRFCPFTIQSGFVPGNNVLEFDVFNKPSAISGPSAKAGSPMALRVELECHGQRRGQTAPPTSDKTPPTSGGKETSQ